MQHRQYGKLGALGASTFLSGTTASAGDGGGTGGTGSTSTGGTTDYTGFESPPTVTLVSSGVVSGGSTKIHGKVKAGSYGLMLYDLTVLQPGETYILEYSADWSLLAQQGKLAMVGFGLKTNNNFNITGLRGDGSTGVHGYEVYGSTSANNGWNKQTGQTTVDAGAAAHGTQSGPNYLKLVTASDGTTMTVSSSTDNVTYGALFTNIAPSPFSNVGNNNVVEFGPAVWINNLDNGAFDVTFLLWQITYPARVRLSQQYGEVVHSGSNNLVRLSQQYTEIVHSGATNLVRLEQQYVEVITELNANSALLQKTSTQAITGQTWTATSFNSAVYDDYGTWSAGAPTQFIVPSTLNGRYGRFSANAEALSGGVGVGSQLTINKNAAFIPGGVVGDNSSVTSAGSYNAVPHTNLPPMALATGDAYTAVTWNDSNSTIENVNGTWFGFELLPASFSGCLAYANASVGMINGDKTVPLDTEVYDVGGWHDAVTNNSRLITLSGKNRIRLTGAGWKNATNGVLNSIRFNKNGSNTAYRGRPNASAGENGDNIGATIMSAPVNVTGGTDYFELVETCNLVNTVAATYLFGAIEAVGTKGALAYKNGGTIAISSTGVFTAMPFDAVDYDDLSFFSAGSPGVFTIPSGVNRVRVGCNIISTIAGRVEVRCLKNGSAFPGYMHHHNCHSGPGGTVNINAHSAIFQVSAGDQITFQVLADTTFSVDGTNADNWWYIESIDSR